MNLIIRKKKDLRKKMDWGFNWEGKSLQEVKKERGNNSLGLTKNRVQKKNKRKKHGGYSGMKT